MSRSYRKNPILKDGGRSSKWGKKQANHKVRKSKHIPLKGSGYKKVYCSWDINDYISYYPLEEAIEDWEREESPDYEGYAWRHDKYITFENWIIQWKKWMLNK